MLQQRPNPGLITPPPPPTWVVAAISVALVLGMAGLRLRLMGDVSLPIGYSIPLILFVWLSDRRFLWASAACYAGIAFIKQFYILPRDPHVPDPVTNLLLQLLDLLFVAGAVHVLIGLRRDLEAGNTRLSSTVEQLTVKEEEIARQNEELQSQTEELERQSEELRITNEDLAAREKTLEHLLALSRALSSDLTRAQVLDHVCEALGYLMGSRAAASAIVERAGQRVSVTCHHGFGPEGLAAEHFSSDEAFSTVVVNRSQTAYLEDLALRPDLRTPQPKSGEPMRSVLATPLRVHGRPVGTIEVYSRQTGLWSEENVALLESLAAQTAISLEAASLFEDVDRERRRFEAVFRTLPIGIVVADAGEQPEVRLNPAAGLMLGLSAETPLDANAGMGAWQLYHNGRVLSRDEHPLWAAIRTAQEFAGDEYELVLPAGRRRTLLISASPIRDRDGKVLGGVAAFTDITDRKGLEREIDQRRREAEESAVRKTRFLAAVSHDIRTPANAINLMAELIRRAAGNPAMSSEVPALAAELQSSATSLVSLVSDVLDLTRFDTGRIELNEAEFPLADAVSEEVRQQSPVAQAKGVALRYEPPAIPILTRTDRVKLGRILGNLIGNAIKFTHSGEVIVSVLIGSDRRAHIHVRDTGVGIDPEHLPRIFDEFFQLRNPERDPSKGTGLGLTICKRLVDAMGGELLVESEPGRGSIFTLVLPAHAVTVSQTPLSPVTILAYGPWIPSQIHLQQVPSSRRILPEVETAIDQAWTEGLARTPKLYDGPMCRLEHLDITPAALTVRISCTSYKPFYGTNLFRPHLRDRFGPEVMANPIGLSPALLTADGHLVFGRRNPSVAYYPGRTHPFSGSLEWNESLFAGLYRELAEELSLTADDLQDPVLLGLIEDPSLRHPEFIFRVTTRKTLSDLQTQLDPEEHNALVAVPAAPDAIALALTQPEFTPVALGALLLFRRHMGWEP